MKKILFFLAFALIYMGCSTAVKQTETPVAPSFDRSVQPPPGPAPTIQIGDSETFTLDNGLRVIVVENDKSPTVSWQLTIDRDPILEGDAAGYVSMAGSELRSGTTNRDKATLDEEIDFIGATLSTGSTGIFASSLNTHTETLLELMSDVTLNPTFPQEELDKSITQTLSGLSTISTNANAIVGNLSSTVVYGENHPYGEVTTDQTVKNITRDLLVDYYETYWRPNISYLVVVGDISAEKVKELANKYFADWEESEVPQMEYTTPQPPEGIRVAFANRPGAVQSVFRVAYPLELTPGHPDLVKVNVMNSILGGGVFSGRLMQNLREDKGYTYGARSRIGTDRLVTSFSAGAEVGNNVTDSAITEVLYEMKRLIEEPVDTESLELVKNFMNGSFARSLESPRTVANFALNIERYNLPEDYYATYLERLEAVTIEDVQEMARQYIKPENAYILVAGSEDEVAPRLAKFATDGNVHFYDHFARPITKSEVNLDESVTAEWVVEQYINAIGGKDNIEKIKDLKSVMTAEMMGSNLRQTIQKMAPHKMHMEFAVGGSVMQKEVFDGKGGYTLAMGQKMEVEEEEIESKKVQAMIVPEMAYLNGGVELELRGVDQVDGNNTYRLRVTTADGTVIDEYYDMESHLKVRDMITYEDGMGQSSTITNDYGNYTEVGGVLFPFSTVVSGVMPMPLEMNVESLEVNVGLDESLFDTN
nr:insulinase family protein [Saprospiraceae bacterium]